MTDHKENKKLNYSNMNYSIHRIDLLIISISGAGVYLCLETLKFCYSNKIPISVSLKVSSGLFIFSILVNFLSQFMAYEANKHEYLVADISDCDTLTKQDEIEIIIHETKAEILNKTIIWANYGSSILMILGLVACFFYFVITF
jgi:hypothetical protein